MIIERVGKHMVSECGDSSVRHAGLSIKSLWVRIPPTAGIKISVARSLSGFTQPIQQNEYRRSVAVVLHIELGFKLWVYVLR